MAPFKVNKSILEFDGIGFGFMVVVVEVEVEVVVELSFNSSKILSNELCTKLDVEFINT